ncbi:type IV secretion system protein VirB7 [Bartonella sp. B39]
MKQKIIFSMILTIALTGCASLSGSKKPPRCKGKHIRVLNRDKWDWDNKGMKNISLGEKIVKHVITPTIVNTLENEKATADIKLNTTSLNPVNHETLFDKTVEVSREK